MTSPHFPFSHVPGEISFFPVAENKGHPPTMGTTDVRQHLKGTYVDVADPRVASCIRFDHRQAIHLLQHRLSLSQKDSIRLQRQKHALGQSPSSRLPTWQDSSTRHKTTQSSIREAYLRGKQIESLKTPFQPLTQNKPTNPAERATMSPWVEPISWHRPRQRDIDTQAHPGHSDVPRRITKLRASKPQARSVRSCLLERLEKFPNPLSTPCPIDHFVIIQSPSELKRREPTRTPYQDSTLSVRFPFNPLSIQ